MLVLCFSGSIDCVCYVDDSHFFSGADDGYVVTCVKAPVFSYVCNFILIVFGQADVNGVKVSCSVFCSLKCLKSLVRQCHMVVSTCSAIVCFRWLDAASGRVCRPTSPQL